MGSTLALPKILRVPNNNFEKFYLINVSRLKNPRVPLQYNKQINGFRGTRGTHGTRFKEAPEYVNKSDTVF